MIIFIDFSYHLGNGFRLQLIDKTLGDARSLAGAARGILEVRHVADPFDIGHFDILGHVLPLGAIPQEAFLRGQGCRGQHDEHHQDGDTGYTLTFHRLTLLA